MGGRDMSVPPPPPYSSPGMPPGWTEHFDHSSGRSYYHNQHTNETSWSKPTAHGIVQPPPPLLQPAVPAAPTVAHGGYPGAEYHQQQHMPPTQVVHSTPVQSTPL